MVLSGKSKIQNPKSKKEKEYYLTDLPGIAQKEGLGINSVEIEPEAALGANTKEQLQILEQILEEREGGKQI